MGEREKIEWLKCSRYGVRSLAYFITEYVWIYNATEQTWLRFALWPRQRESLDALSREMLLVILKARQLGMTWLCLALVLWIVITQPYSTALLFSRRDDEAVELLSRLKGMYSKLPSWLQARGVETDNDHEWVLSNGSVVRCFPTSAGDSYTATIVLVDEADLVPDLGRLMRAVKPTIDAGGKMILLSRSDKDKPQSYFKRTYRAAKEKKNEWFALFLPWHARPSRTEAWYEAQKRDVLINTGGLDDLYEQYPATDTEALSAATLSKRIPAEWLESCYVEMEPLAGLPSHAPAIPGLQIYRLPEAGRTYVCGADSAEGLPTSDDSAATWLDAESGEEVASLSGKIPPDQFAAALDEVGRFYNDADTLPERNNHGHAVIQWMEEHSRLLLLCYTDERPGWMSSRLGKTLLYTEAAQQFRNQETTIHSFKTHTQLASVERSTLLAPDGEMDDCADGYALAQMARVLTANAGPQYGSG